MFRFVWNLLTDETTFRMTMGGAGLAIDKGMLDVSAIGGPPWVGIVLVIVALSARSTHVAGARQGVENIGRTITRRNGK